MPQRYLLFMLSNEKTLCSSHSSISPPEIFYLLPFWHKAFIKNSSACKYVFHANLTSWVDNSPNASCEITFLK